MFPSHAQSARNVNARGEGLEPRLAERGIPDISQRRPCAVYTPRALSSGNYSAWAAVDRCGFYGTNMVSPYGVSLVASG